MGGKKATIEMGCVIETEANMAQDDFGEGTGQQNFQASLREQCTQEIKFDLIVNKIVDPEMRALAEIELERRCADLADYQKRVRRQKWVINTAAVGVMVAAASAIAAWLEMAAVASAIAAWLG